jgi:hypothetical protein
MTAPCKRGRGRPRTRARCGEVDPIDADHVCDLAEHHSGRHIAADGSDWEPERLGGPPRERYIYVRVTEEEQERWRRVADELETSVAETVRSQLDRLERETGVG